MSSVSGQGGASSLTTQSYTLALVKESSAATNLGVSRVQASLEGAVFLTEDESKVIRVLPQGSQSKVSICNVPSTQLSVEYDALFEHSFRVFNPDNRGLTLQVTFYPIQGSCESQQRLAIGYDSGDRQNFESVTFAGNTFRLSLCRNFSSPGSRASRPQPINPANPPVTHRDPSKAPSGPVIEMTAAEYRRLVRSDQIDAYVGDNNLTTFGPSLDSRNVVITDYKESQVRSLGTEETQQRSPSVDSCSVKTSDDEEYTTLGPDTSIAPTPTSAQESSPKRVRTGLREAWL